MATVDWASLAQEADKVQVLPVGKYDVICLDAELNTSNTSGNEYFKTRWRVNSGPHAGRVIYNNFVIVADNAKALRMLFRNLEKFGITVSDLQAAGSTEMACSLFPGRQAIFDVNHREWNGEVQENVQGIAPHPSGPRGSLMVGGSGAPVGGSGAPVSTPAVAPPAHAPSAQPAATAPQPQAATQAAPAALTKPPAPAPASAPAPQQPTAVPADEIQTGQAPPELPW